MPHMPRCPVCAVPRYPAAQLETKLALDSNADWRVRTGIAEPSDVKVRSLLSSVQISAYAKQVDSVVGRALGPLALDPTVDGV
jgi:hypothetical protein